MRVIKITYRNMTSLKRVVGSICSCIYLVAICYYIFRLLTFLLFRLVGKMQKISMQLDIFAYTYSIQSDIERYISYWSRRQLHFYLCIISYIMTKSDFWSYTVAFYLIMYFIAYWRNRKNYFLCLNDECIKE